LTSFG
jgi:hypothetical protein